MKKMPRPATVLPYLKWPANARLTRSILRSGEPLTQMKPLPSASRSSGRASSSSAAISSRVFFASSAAMMIALPARCVVRLANVPMQCGPVSVSPVSMSTFSIGTPSASAPICARTVLRPWPRSALARLMTKRAGRRHVDQRLGGVAAQVHAGRVVDRRNAGPRTLAIEHLLPCRTGACRSGE